MFRLMTGTTETYFDDLLTALYSVSADDDYIVNTALEGGVIVARHINGSWVPVYTQGIDVYDPAVHNRGCSGTPDDFVEWVILNPTRDRFMVACVGFQVGYDAPVAGWATPL